jgi:CHASE3 domain sensor protein
MNREPVSKPLLAVFIILILIAAVVSAVVFKAIQTPLPEGVPV